MGVPALSIYSFSVPLNLFLLSPGEPVYRQVEQGRSQCGTAQHESHITLYDRSHRAISTRPQAITDPRLRARRFLSGERDDRAGW